MPEVSPPQSPSALAAHALLLGGAGAAIFIAGGAPQGNLGVFLLAAGVALTACPPRARVEWRLWGGAAGLVACTGLAFLPWRWLPVPLWRRVIGAAPAVTLPGSITAAPAETAFWVALLALSLVIGLFALSQPVRARGMISLALAAVITCAAYALLAMYAKLSGWHYPFSGGATFGFLPNRNHTATLLITGSVVAAGLMSVAFRDRRWAVADAAILGALAGVTALCFFSESRAGVLILLAGGALWLAGLGGRHRPRGLLAAVAVVTVAAGGLFLAFKSPARDRLLDMVGIKVAGGAKPTPAPTPGPTAGPPTGGGSAVAEPSAGGAPVDPPSEFRMAIYRDALGMIRDQPWTGTGLGTFAGVFPQYRRESLVEFNALHPESDWLMLMAEAGLPAFLCATMLAGLALRRLAGLGEHPYWPLRWGIAAAAMAAGLHGAVDVPAHRVALGWWVLALAGLALQRQGGKAEGGEWQRRAQHAVFVLAGVGSLALGGMLVRAEWFHGSALPPFVPLVTPQRIFDAYQHQDYANGTALARQILRDAPLTPAAYYYLGILLAVSDEEGVDQQVDDQFQAERVLDPVMPDVPRRQALAWAGYDPVRQTAMEMAELGRKGRIDRGVGAGLKLDLPYYADLVSNARGQSDVQRYLLAVARPDPRFEARWEQRATPALAQSRADRLAADEALVGAGGVARPDWYLQPESAGPVRPDKRAGSDPEWASAAWPVRLRQMVYARQYRQAVEALAGRYGISLALPEPGGGGGDVADGSGADGAFPAAWRAGDQAGARRALAAATVDVADPASLEIWRWRAALAAHDAHWREAWLGLERYVQHTRQTEWP